MEGVIEKPNQVRNIKMKVSQLKNIVIGLSIFCSNSNAASVSGSETWMTLKPTNSISDAATDRTAPFGIVVETIASSVTGEGNASTASIHLGKRAEASQITDGQVQVGTETTANAATPKHTEPLVNQITDGQPQATTLTTRTRNSPALVSQIGDGQVQATTGTAATGNTDTTRAHPAGGDLVSQIGDGQIQATTGTHRTRTNAGLASQIGDGQVQLQTGTATTGNVASQIGDGQIQATQGAGTGDSEVSCSSEDTLTMRLEGSVLKDSQQRVGSIVSNHQFQFDAIPQAGALYAAGWGVTKENYLAIGDNDVFYECLSGNFFNLYDSSIGGQCNPVHLKVVDLVEC